MMQEILKEVERIEIEIYDMESEGNFTKFDGRNRRFLVSELRLKINRLTEEYKKTEKSFKIANKKEI
jgi:hypothetical protein